MVLVNPEAWRILTFDGLNAAWAWPFEGGFLNLVYFDLMQ